MSAPSNLKTIRDVRIIFRDIHDVLVPAGTDVIPFPCANNTGLAVHASKVKLLSDTEAAFKHDSQLYYVWLRKEHLDPVAREWFEAQKIKDGTAIA